MALTGKNKSKPLVEREYAVAKSCTKYILELPPGSRQRVLETIQRSLENPPVVEQEVDPRHESLPLEGATSQDFQV